MRYIEEWKTCNPCSDYEVSNYAQVRECETKRIIEAYVIRSTVYVPLKHNGEIISYPLDEIVARSFYGDRPANHKLVHINDNPFDNDVDNLAWIPKSKAPLPKSISYNTRVRCIENGKIYDNLYECSEDLSISKRKIINSIKNTRFGVRYPYTFEILD